MSEEELSQRAMQAIINLDAKSLKDILGPGLKEQGSEEAFKAIDTILVPALERMGSLWEQGELALSQLYLSGKLCEELFAQWPEGAGQRITRPGPRMGLAVLEDYHLLGKRMVHAALMAGGYAVSDYGRVTAEALIEKVRTEGIELLFISTLMLPSALRVEAVCSALSKAKLDTRVIVGGAPFRYDRQLWKEVGAHGMGLSATDALRFAQSYPGAVS